MHAIYWGSDYHYGSTDDILYLSFYIYFFHEPLQAISQHMCVYISIINLLMHITGTRMDRNSR